MKNGIITALVVVAFIAGYFVGNNYDIVPKNAGQATEKAQKPQKEVSKYAKNLISYNKAMKSDKPALVFFYADWCGYCKRFAPSVPVLKEKFDGKINIAMVNCEDSKNAEIVGKYDIKGYPTLYLINPKTGASEYIHYENYYDIEKMEEYINNYLSK